MKFISRDRVSIVTGHCASTQHRFFTISGNSGLKIMRNMLRKSLPGKLNEF